MESIWPMCSGGGGGCFFLVTLHDVCICMCARSHAEGGTSYF